MDGEHDYSQIVKYLNEIQLKYGTFTSFFVSDRTYIYYHSDGILKKVNPEEPRDEWYFRVRDMSDEYEINVDPDLANRDALTIFINYRVYDYDHNYIGATGVGLTVDAVRKLIDKYQRKYGRIIYFVNDQGEVTLHGQTFPYQENNIFRREGISSIADEIIKSDNSSLEYKLHGRPVDLNIRYIDEFDWHLIVEQVDNRSHEELFNTLMLNLLICIVVIFVVLMLTGVTINAYQRRLEKLASTDKLTGLYNRQAFDTILDLAVREARRRKTPLSLIMFDIDRFKLVNDSYGHLPGDEVLKHIVRTSEHQVRESDTLCRWGGEEFLILLKECSQEDAYAVAEKIRLAVMSAPTEYNGVPIPATVSLGVAQFHSQETREMLLDRVDSALYEAKRAGRNATRRAEPAAPAG